MKVECGVFPDFTHHFPHIHSVGQLSLPPRRLKGRKEHDNTMPRYSIDRELYSVTHPIQKLNLLHTFFVVPEIPRSASNIIHTLGEKGKACIAHGATDAHATFFANVIGRVRSMHRCRKQEWLLPSFHVCPLNQIGETIVFFILLLAPGVYLLFTTVGKALSTQRLTMQGL